MAQVGQVKDGHAEKLEECVGGGGLAVGQFDGAGDQLPVRLGQAAVGHGAVDDAVAALAGLQADPPGEEERVGRAVNHGAAGPAHAHGTCHVVKARGVHVQPHLAVRGFDEDVVGAAGNLQVAFSLQFRGGLVIDHLVGTQDVVAVVDYHIAGQGPGVACAGLALRFNLHRNAGHRGRLSLGDRDHLETGILGKCVRCR